MYLYRVFSFPTALQRLLHPIRLQHLSDQGVSRPTTLAETREAGRTKATSARPVRVVASMETAVRLQTTVLRLSAKVLLENAIPLLSGGVSLQMVLAGTLEKATTLATFARLACAAASTATVVALQITAPLRRAARHHLVAAQVSFS